MALLPAGGCGGCPWRSDRPEPDAPEPAAARPSPVFRTVSVEGSHREIGRGIGAGSADLARAALAADPW